MEQSGHVSALAWSWPRPGRGLAALALAGLGWPFSGLALLVLLKRGPSSGWANCSAGLSSGWPVGALTLIGLHKLFHACPGWVSQGDLVLPLLDPDLTGRDLVLALVRNGSDLVEPWT